MYQNYKIIPIKIIKGSKKLPNNSLKLITRLKNLRYLVNKFLQRVKISVYVTQILRCFPQIVVHVQYNVHRFCFGWLGFVIDYWLNRLRTLVQRFCHTYRFACCMVMMLMWTGRITRTFAFLFTSGSVKKRRNRYYLFMQVLNVFYTQERCYILCWYLTSNSSNLGNYS